MGIHEWSYDSLVVVDKRYLVPHAEKVLFPTAPWKSNWVSTRPRASKNPALPELRCADRFQHQPLHRVRRLHGHLPDVLHHLH